MCRRRQLILLAGCLVALGCSSTATPRTVRVASTPTRSRTLAVVNEACRHFIAGDARLGPVTSDDEGQRTLARGRTELLRDARRTLQSIDFAPSLRPVRRRVAALLDKANALYAQVLRTGPTNSLGAQAQDTLRQVVAALYAAGAQDCVAQSRPSPVSPPPANAGELLTRDPVATVTVGPLGADDNRIVADSDGVWVGLKNTGEVIRIDPRTNTVVARVAVGGEPSGLLAIVDGYVMVTTTAEMLRIDPATNAIDQRRSLASLGFGSDFGVAFTPTAQYTCSAGVLRVADPVSGLPVRTVPVAIGCETVAAAGDVVWVRTLGMDTVRIDPVSGAQLGPVLPTTAAYAQLLFGGGDLWARTLDRVSRIDPVSGRVLGVVQRDGMNGLQSSVGGGAMWTTSDREQRVLRIDADTMKVQELQAGPGANAVAYAAGTLWVANSDASTVMRFDVSDLQ